MSCPRHVCRFAGALLAATLCCGRLAASEITVFAAASLSDALREIAGTYKKTTGDIVRLNLGASSVLARQIKEGAPADLFFSADEAKMNDLAKAGLIDPATRRNLLSNSLVIVVAADSDLKLAAAQDLANAAVRRLALAEPETVPAGIYAREYLQKQGLWEAVAGKTVPTENVRAVLAAVESGNVDAGIVYKTDGLSSKKIRITYEVPRDEGPRISYPLAVIKGGGNPRGASRLLAWLTSPAGKSVFAKYGFITEP
jgi:molybdate transport system substrate-binding protein